MNRKDFFKKLGLGAVTILVAPKVLAETKVDKPKYIAGCDPIGLNTRDIAGVKIWHNENGAVFYNKRNESTLRIVRNGFYYIGDIIKSYDKTWIVWYYDDDYYYCIPQ